MELKREIYEVCKDCYVCYEVETNTVRFMNAPTMNESTQVVTVKAWDCCAQFLLELMDAKDKFEEVIITDDYIKWEREVEHAV